MEQPSDAMVHLDLCIAQVFRPLPAARRPKFCSNEISPSEFAPNEFDPNAIAPNAIGPSEIIPIGGVTCRGP